MNLKLITTSRLFVATLIGLGVSVITASGQTEFPPVITPPSNIVDPSDAGVRSHTNIKILGVPPMNGASVTFGPPVSGLFYETPASLACIYDLVTRTAGCNPNTVTTNPSGGSKAIAIVDAFDDPNAATDLQSFSTQFGVASITPTSFQVVYAPKGGATLGSCSGAATKPPSAAGTGWDLEESLDTQYAHAMAPQATLYLVEAQSNSNTDLYCAVTVANGLVSKAGGGEISMSWSGSEFSGETKVDAIFKKPNIVYFASTGDAPGVGYPAVSPNVVAVGGTSLSTNTSTGALMMENTWQSGGGGASALEPKPAYQTGVAGITGTTRHTPDVSFDANPYTGVYVLDTLASPPGWYAVGGTSVGTPSMAGIVNVAGAFAASTVAELTTMYANAATAFSDITYGDCGPYMSTFAKKGWDACTGLGSPKTYTGK